MSAEPTNRATRLPLKFFVRQTREEWARRLLEDATILKPEGDGPFPLVLQYHGCGGPRPIQTYYGQEAVKAGFAVVNVDSFKPRRIAQFDAIHDRLHQLAAQLIAQQFPEFPFEGIFRLITGRGAPFGQIGVEFDPHEGIAADIPELLLQFSQPRLAGGSLRFQFPPLPVEGVDGFQIAHGFAGLACHIHQHRIDAVAGAELVLPHLGEQDLQSRQPGPFAIDLAGGQPGGGDHGVEFCLYGRMQKVAQQNALGQIAVFDDQLLDMRQGGRVLRDFEDEDIRAGQRVLDFGRAPGDTRRQHMD